MIPHTTIDMPNGRQNVEPVHQPIRIGPILFDILMCILVGILFMLIPQLLLQPFQRGFFCQDQSIRYPYKPNTISAPVLGIIIVAMIIVTIGSVELYRLVRLSKVDAASYTLRGVSVSNFLVRSLTYGAYCVFGLLANFFFCQITKFAVGRLRPHFLAVCQPNVNLSCGENYAYITDYTCSGPAKAVKEARLSFFSGHSSMAMGTAVYCALYLQARLPRRMYGISLLPVFQLLLIGSALLVGYSRIADYWHHWSDVLVGYLVGVATGCFSAVSLGQLRNRQGTMFSVEERFPLVDSVLPSRQPINMSPPHNMQGAAMQNVFPAQMAVIQPPNPVLRPVNGGFRNAGHHLGADQQNIDGAVV